MKTGHALAVASAVPMAATVVYGFIFHVALFSLRFNYLLAAILVEASLPYGVYSWLEERRKFIVERESLAFLTDLESQVRSGRTIFEGIKEALEGRKKEFKEIAGKFEAYTRLGMSPLDALREIGRMMPTQVSREVFSVVERVALYGGDVPSVLAAVRQHIADLFALEDERRSIARNYGMVILVSYFMLLVIIYMLVRYLLIPTGFASGGPFGFRLSPSAVMPYVDQFLIIEAFVSGLLMGKIMTGKTVSGLLYSVILIVITIMFISIL